MICLDTNAIITALKDRASPIRLSQHERADAVHFW